MNTTIRIRLSDAGRKADILTGGTGEEYPSIIIPPDAPEFREVVTAGKIADGEVVLDCRYAHDATGLPGWDAMPTAREVLAALTAKATAKQAEEARQAQERHNATAAVLAERRTSQYVTGLRYGVRWTKVSPDWPYYRDSTVLDSPEAQAWQAEIDAANVAAEATAKAQEAEADATEKAKAEEKAAAEAARRETLGLREGDDDFRTANGALEQVPCYQSHKRGKNWLATITVDPSKPGGLDRDFAAKAHGDAYYMLPRWEPGDAIEFGADYYTGAGRKSAERWYGYVVRVDPECVVLHKCSTGKSAAKEGAKFAASLATAAK